MTTDNDFTAWAKDTQQLASSAANAVQFDTTAGMTANADAAQSLGSALAQVQADFEQGVQTGSAPQTYQDDAKEVVAAAEPFGAC